MVDLKKAVKALYEDAFKELDSFAEQQKVSKAKYADKEYTINGIDHISSLAALKNRELSVADFKSKQLELIIAATETDSGEAAESETYYVTKGATTISTTEELEVYLEKVRKEMTKLIIENKTIILK